jgi:hypothetical protein
MYGIVICKVAVSWFKKYREEWTRNEVENFNEEGVVSVINLSEIKMYMFGRNPLTVG